VSEDGRWLAGAASLAARARPLSRPNPGVGAIILQNGRVVGRGWTGQGGRPHAEAAALAQAGVAARGATLYVTLEPCAHVSQRGPACADLLAQSGIGRVVIGCMDPDPRTSGRGVARLRAAGIETHIMASAQAEASLSGYLMQAREHRPFITLKLALSIDGCLARPVGQDRWITGEAARAHCHALRAKSDAILVGSGTLLADRPGLDVRLPGLEARSPERWLLSRGAVPEGFRALASPEAVRRMGHVQYLFVEGGEQTARAFIAAGLVDCLTIYRAPFEIGPGVPALPELSRDVLGRSDSPWRITERRQLGNDALEVYEASPCSPE
jgi:diaminohydroxyphosphoribosylaminopyrimidine deaminase/5-amino-6-(5-phosphoribosylamino)uracil reductase